MKYSCGIMWRSFANALSALFRRPFPWLLLIGCAVIMATFLHSAGWELDFFFTSDTLYLPSIYRDVFEDGGKFLDWSLNPAPNFFPDMGLYFLLNWLFGNLRAASYFFPMVQFVLIACLFRAVVRTSGINSGDHGVSMGVLLLTLVLLTGWWGGDFGFAFHLLVNSFHGGAFVNALLCTWLLLRVYAHRGAWPWVLLALACMAGSVSDKLFWVMFSVPAIVACSILAVRSPLRSRLLWMALLVAASTWLAYKSMLLLDEALPFAIENPYAYLAFDRVVFSWGRFLEMLRVYINGHPLVAGTILLGLFMTAATMVHGIKRFVYWLRATSSQRTAMDERVLLVEWMTALFLPFVLLVPVVNGSFDGLDSLRYDFAVFALAPLLAGSWLGRRMGKRGGGVVLAGALIIGVPAIGVCLTAGSAGYQRLWDYRPASVEAFDRLTHGMGLRNGVADYWTAKRLTMFSDQHVMVLPVFPEVGTYIHVNRPEMFYDSVFTFVIVHPTELPKEDLIHIFHQDTGFHATDGIEVLVTPPWKFDPMMHKPVIKTP